jgi:hypothetical protein
MHRSGHNAGLGGKSVSELSPRQVTLGVAALAAGYAGIAGLYIIPTWLLDFDSEGSIFAVRLVAGVVALAFGLAVLKQRLVSGLLMAVGVITIFLATPYVFSHFGSSGILLVIFLVLAALIGLTVWLSKKGKTA